MFYAVIYIYGHVNSHICNFPRCDPYRDTDILAMADNLRLIESAGAPMREEIDDLSHFCHSR